MRVLANSRKTASICTRKTARTAVSLPALAWQNLLYLREERQPVLAKPYRVESRAFSSISRQTACMRTVGIPSEIVRLAAFLREDTRSRGFTRDSRSRILSRANAINNFGRAHIIVSIPAPYLFSYMKLLEPFLQIAKIVFSPFTKPKK